MITENSQGTPSMQKEQPLSNAAYHDHPAVSKSHLDEVHKSGRHYWARYLDPERVKPQPTPAMELGSGFHAMVLEPDVYENDFVTAPEIKRTTKAGREEWAAFLNANKKKTVLTVDQVELLRSMTEAVMSHPAASTILRLKGEAEQTYTWTDDQTGEACKCRPDWHAEGLVVDLKSTVDASPDGFAKSVNNFRYHVQANWYLRGTPNAEQFVFIACEKTPPFAVAVYVASPEMVAAGGRAADQDLARLAEYRRENVWPSYSNQIETLNLPRWNND
jgi:exodeoxyribonuclease VIII